MIIKPSLLATAVLLTAAPLGSAAIVLSGDFINGTTTPTLTITEDIIFTIASDGNAFILVFDEWTVSDSTPNDPSDDPAQNLTYNRNGSGLSTPIGNLVDNLASTVEDITPNDGYLTFTPNGIPVTAGDSLTISARSYTFESDPGFNPLLTGTTFTGDVFLTDGGANRISDIVAVPEPSAALLCCLLGMAPLLRRRR